MEGIGGRRHQSELSNTVHPKGKRKWEFCTVDEQLFRICDVKIHRHVKTRNNTNPYIDVEYYAEKKTRHKYERGYRDKSFAI